MRTKEILNIFFFIVVSCLSLFFVVAKFFPNTVNHIFPYKHYVVISNSMEPVINTYDVVIVKDVEIDTLKIDDIITFETQIENKDAFVTHYIAEINNTKFRTRPHVSNQMDPWTLTPNDIQGKVVSVIPYIGKPLLIFYNNALPILLLTNGLVIYTMYKVYHSKQDSTQS